MRLRSVILALALLALASCRGPDGREPKPAAAPARVVGYFTNWGVYAREYHVKNVVTSGAADRLTHLLYAFGKVTGGGCALGDRWADHQKPVPASTSVDGVADDPSAELRGNFGQLRKLKAAYPNLKILWSFGGWTGSAGFTEAARDPARFAESCRSLLTDARWAGLFDGIDVDWEYPNACGVRCDESGPDALTELLGALRTALGPDRLITAAVPGDVQKLRATDYAGAARHADWLGAMTYDYFGTGDSGRGRTAAHSPLTAYPGIPRESATAETTVSQLLALGVPPAKVLLGIGFYGRGWTGVGDAGPGGPAGGLAPGRFERGMEDYRLLATRCPPTGTAGGTAYARCGAEWWSYDTPETVRAKMAYVRSRGLGGAFAWELSGDTTRSELLAAMT